MKSDKIKMELYFSEKEMDKLKMFAERVSVYDEWMNGNYRKQNCSLATRYIMNLLLSGEIKLPDLDAYRMQRDRCSRRYRPVVYRYERDEFLKFCKEKHYAPHQAILWVIDNIDINQYLRYEYAYGV